MKLLLYCTKAKPYLFNQNIYEFYDSEYITSYCKCHEKNDYTLNGKIVAECDFEVEEIFGISKGTNQPDKYDFKWEDRILNGACLTNDQMNDYVPNYAIHIKNLHIFEEPRDLRDYSKNENPYNYIENAPQNMMYAYDVKSFNNFEKKVLISIRPEWLCKILNGEKTIEVRKKVLKEMVR